MTTTAIAQTTPRPRSRLLRRIGFIAGGVVLALALLIGFSAWYMSYVPSDLDYSTARTTENGLYQVSYQPSQNPIPVNELHTWTLTLATAAGEQIDGAQIGIDGDMPQHGHGLPTQPQVTRSLGDGRYLIEGVKFQMGGWWVMDFDITTAAGTDKVRFNFLLDQ